MSLLSNLLSFSSLVHAYLLRMHHLKNNKDHLRQAVGFCLRLKILTNLMKLRKDLYRKVCQKWG